MMRRGIGTTLAIVGAALIVATALVSADRLVLRDGTRIDGQLISVQRGTIEFREERGWRGTRTIQVPRDEVARIELDETTSDQPVDRQPVQPGQVQGNTRPGGMREREVWVAANRQWTDTGIDVRDGQPVYFTTHNGDIQYRRGEHTRAGGDPGERYNANRPMANRPIGALLGKVGAESGDYFFIGDSEDRFRLRGSGRLFLGINDENVSDNVGAYRVTIYY